MLLAALWAWAVWSCAEHWIGNPNYSYGWVVPLLAAAFAARRLVGVPSVAAATRPPVAGALLLVVALFALALAGLLEFAREEVWHPEMVLWTICALAVAATFAILQVDGGMPLVRRLAFPVLFFLTAVPWPPRLEQPLTSGLMQWVAAATVEILRLLGIEAQASGGAIALHDGVVGVTEACSGIRSLQSGIMFGLAMGEWFLLSAGRRFVLLGCAIAFALTTNLVRTLLLSLQADRHGVASVESVHDLIGTIMISTLIAAIWLTGKLLSTKRPPFDVRDIIPAARRFGVAAATRHGRLLVAAACAVVVGLISARAVSAHLEARDHTQLTPFFTVRSQGPDALQQVQVPREIWNELRPSTGEYVRLARRDLPGGAADTYHFFWKPSPWNRFALVHRPDVCMPGIGWETVGQPTPVQVDFGDRGVRCYAFRFRRGNVHALELWGVWRNGDSVPIDYTTDQALGASAPPSQLNLEGKRRSATEIVACSVIGENEPPAVNIAVAVLQSVFHYSPQ